MDATVVTVQMRFLEGQTHLSKEQTSTILDFLNNYLVFSAAESKQVASELTARIFARIPNAKIDIPDQMVANARKEKAAKREKKGERKNERYLSVEATAEEQKEKEEATKRMIDDFMKPVVPVIDPSLLQDIKPKDKQTMFFWPPGKEPVVLEDLNAKFESLKAQEKMVTKSYAIAFYNTLGQPMKDALWFEWPRVLAAIDAGARDGTTERMFEMQLSFYVEAVRQEMKDAKSIDDKYARDFETKQVLFIESCLLTIPKEYRQHRLVTKLIADIFDDVRGKREITHEYMHHRIYDVLKTMRKEEEDAKTKDIPVPDFSERYDDVNKRPIPPTIKPVASAPIPRPKLAPTVRRR
jgi:hypothetical protein